MYILIAQFAKINKNKIKLSNCSAFVMVVVGVNGPVLNLLRDC